MLEYEWYEVRACRDESGADYEIRPAILQDGNVEIAQEEARVLWAKGRGGYVVRISDGARWYPSEAKWVSRNGQEVPA